MLQRPSPDAAPDIAHRACPECRAAFVPALASQLFCTPTCTNAWHNRWTARGRRWAQLAAVARLTRSGTRGAHLFARRASNDADHLLRRWIAEDARANDGRGRMDVRDFNDLRYRAGFEPV